MSQTKAAELKVEGNTLFAKQQYALAHAKYGDAIAEDGTNAVLYANRAACSLSMCKFLDAATDARKATELDPSYPKAWARLASAHVALCNVDKAIDAWKKAIDTLPKENLNSGELKQKEQYQAGWEAAVAHRRNLESSPGHSGINIGNVSGKAPWDIAKAMRPELERRGVEMAHSSAWVILNAYEEFIEGVGHMKNVTLTDNGAFGRLGVLEMLSNGCMRDSRAFHISDADWVSQYNKQVIFEATKHRAWKEAGPELVIAEAQERLRQEGWESLRPSLSVTIRAWLMRGFLEAGLKGNLAVKVEFLGRALEVLDWGRKHWKNVHRDDKGCIFDDTFIRGLRSMYIEALMHAYAKDGSKFSLEDMLEEADDVLRDIDEHPLDRLEPHDPGFISSFVVYPTGAAYAIKGFYHSQMGHLRKASGDLAAAVDHRRKASNFYLKAGTTYPDDDEIAAWYLNCAFQNAYCSGAKVKEGMAIISQLLRSVSKMSEIWKHSAMASEGRDNIINSTLKMGNELAMGLEKGTITLDDVMP